MTKILLVDDDKFLVRVYKMKMENKGYEVRILDTPETTVQVATDFEPNIIVLDLVMPKVGGFEVLKQLKSNATTKSIPVYMLSIMGNQDDFIKANQLGAVGYAQKTNISIDDFIIAIEKYLN